MKICVTGALGFIGYKLCNQLLKKTYDITAPIRKISPSIINTNKKINFFEIGNIDCSSNWSNALDGVDCVIHCASRAHYTKEETDKLETYRKVNVEGTKKLAKQAVDKGVKRFVYLSSIKVNGESTSDYKSFKHNDTPCPEDSYGISKWEAEQALWEISDRTGLEIVIIRPPLVYGEGVKGNFLRLLNLINKNIPLPFGKIDNHRSIMGLDNLIDVIICTINHKRAAGETFLVSDNEYISTPELIKKLGKNLGKKPLLIPIPISLIRLLGNVIRKKSELDRLLGSLKIDNSRTREILDWKPLMSTDEALLKTTQWYLNRK